jgi:hypothetical protein
MTKKQKYNDMLNESSSIDSLIYLTVECSSRTKATAAKAKRLLMAGNYAEALRTADPIGYNVGFNEFSN